MSTEFLPRNVRRLVDDLTRDTGVVPTVERVDTRTIRLVHRNERVYMDMDFRTTAGRSRYLNMHSTLVVDGERVNLADNYREYVRIFQGAEPSEFAHSHRMRHAHAPDVEKLPEDFSVPAIVRHAYGNMRVALERISRDDPEVREKITIGVYRRGDALVVRSVTANGNILDQNFVQYGGCYGWSFAGKSFEVFKPDGTAVWFPISEITEAINALAGTPSAGAGTAPSTQGSPNPGHSRSAQMRRDTVIRV